MGGKIGAISGDLLKYIRERQHGGWFNSQNLHELMGLKRCAVEFKYRIAVLSLWYDQKGKAKIAGSLSLIRSKCLSTLEEGSKYLSVSHAVQNLNLTDCKFEALGTNLTYVVLLNSRRSNVSFHFGIHHEVMKWENLALSSVGFDFTAKWLQFFYPVIVTQVRWASLKWENYGVSFMWFYLFFMLVTDSFGSFMCCSSILFVFLFILSFEDHPSFKRTYSDWLPLWPAGWSQWPAAVVGQEASTP